MQPLETGGSSADRQKIHKFVIIQILMYIFACVAPGRQRNRGESGSRGAGLQYPGTFQSDAFACPLQKLSIST